MTDALDPIRADIHLGHLQHNARWLMAHAGPSPLVAVVKADAYGHGAAQVVPALLEAGVEWLAVATVPEGIALRGQGVEVPILVFAAPLPHTLPAYAEHDLDVTISSVEVAEAAISLGQPLRVHLKVDTGMGRIGVTPDEAGRVVTAVERAPHLKLVGLWTHFATADEPDALDFAHAQWARFRAVAGAVGEAFQYEHVANTGALFNLPDTIGTERRLVRSGISLYGAADPEGVPGSEALQPVMRLSTRIVHLKRVEAGTSISYGRRWVAPGPRHIATLRCGYADGYPRHLTNRGKAAIGERHFPVVGTVCMDMMMLDLGLLDSTFDAHIGDEVVLFGEGGPAVQELARWGDTIPYEICTRVGARVPRQYRRA